MPEPHASDPHVPPARINAPFLLLAWGLVGVPLAWGVYQTIVKSLALFR